MKKIAVLVSFILFLAGCNPQVADLEVYNEEQVANQIGDVMATIDEAGKGSSTIASYKLESFNKFSQKNHISKKQQMASLFYAQPVIAESCGASQFSSCSSNSVIRNFNGCSVGGYTLSGSVSLNWTGGAGCVLSSTGQSILINPNYMVSANGLDVQISKVNSTGISLTWDSGTTGAKVFKYKNFGVRRSAVYNDKTLIDITTSTSSDITISGETRGARSAHGGSMQMTNNLTGEVCTVSPQNISWGSSNCNCATSGSWTGNCSSSGNITLTLNSCGRATVTYIDAGTTKNKAVSLDRCVQN